MTVEQFRSSLQGRRRGISVWRQIADTLKVEIQDRCYADSGPLQIHWSKVSKKNEVSFFDLPHGQYSFIIQSFENLKIIDQKQFKFELIEPANNDIFTNIFYYLGYVYEIIITISPW